MVDFNVEQVEPLIIHAETPLSDCAQMSPYVWCETKGGPYFIMLRAVPPATDAGASTGAIYYGVSQDGLTFDMDKTPAIAPGPGALDAGGCEDPTVVKWEGRYIVYYTGVDESRSCGQLLWAAGEDIRGLKKMGVALASSKTEGNTKEATIARTKDDRWRLFYEYAQDNASLIGIALGDHVDGPWTEQPSLFKPRPDAWDSWHLSTGPLLTDDPQQPVMLYNGATEDARWRIGWVAFDETYSKVTARCVEPLITPPPPEDRSAPDIAFAGSMVAENGQTWVYYSLEDRKLFRALIRRS